MTNVMQQPDDNKYKMHCIPCMRPQPKNVLDSIQKKKMYAPNDKSRDKNGPKHLQKTQTEYIIQWVASKRKIRYEKHN